jgi:Uma2 family endonuclease
MSITTEAGPRIRGRASGLPTEPIWRLSVKQYHEMIEVGILDEDDPVELLEGWLVLKMPKNRLHTIATQLIRDLFSRIMPAGWHVTDQEPITTKESEPEPDLSIVRGSLRDDTGRRPGPRDVALVIEVAGATLGRDRGLKKRIHARARIPAYWIVNLIECKIEVYTDPSGPGRKPDYRSRQDFGPEDAVPLMVEGREVASLSVRDLLP